MKNFSFYFRIAQNIDRVYNEGDGLMKQVMEWKMEGKRGPGSKRIGMIDEVMENERYGDLKRRAEDRQGWRVWLPATCRMAEH